MSQNTTGFLNYAAGSAALYSNTTGIGNAAIGGHALYANTTGGGNIAIGAGAGLNLTTGSSNIDISSPGVTADTRTIRLGTSAVQTRTFIAGINGASVPGPARAVVISANGQLGTAG